MEINEKHERIKDYVNGKIIQWEYVMPPPPPPPVVEQGEEVLDSINLNLVAPEYNRLRRPTNINEIVDCWFNQCKQVAGNFGQNVEVASSLNELRDHHHYIGKLQLLAIAVAPQTTGPNPKTVALGYMCHFLDVDEGITYFVAVNYGSNMRLRDFAFGEFTTGCRTTINTLTAKGAQVIYRANTRTWTFAHAPELHVLVQRLLPDQENTQVEVQVKSTKQVDGIISTAWQIVPEHYLFLWRHGCWIHDLKEEFVSVQSAPQADIELIFKPGALRGHVYFNDLFVWRDTNQTVGINFIGDPTNAVADGFGSDVIINRIIRNLPLLLEKVAPIALINGRPVPVLPKEDYNSLNAEKICKSILRELRADYPQGQYTSQSYYTSNGWLSSAINLMSMTENLGYLREFLIYYLIEEERSKRPSQDFFQYVPVSYQTAPSESSTWATSIRVPEILMTLIGGSDFCPTLTMIGKFRDEIARLPDARANCPAWVTSTTQLLKRLFDIDSEVILFKDLKGLREQDTSLISSVIHLSEEKAYVIDVSMLDKEKLHKRLNKDGVICNDDECCISSCARELLIYDFKWCCTNGRRVDEKLLDRRIRLELLKMNRENEVFLGTLFY